MAKQKAASTNRNILYVFVAIILVVVIVVFSKKPAKDGVPHATQNRQQAPVLKEIPDFSVEPPSGWRIASFSNTSEDVLLSYRLVSPDYTEKIAGGIKDITSGAEIWVQALPSKHKDIESYKSQAIMLKNSKDIEVAGMRAIRSECGHPTRGGCIHFIKDGVLYQLAIFPEGNTYEAAFQEVVNSITFN